jgi:hypothetical protein
MLLNVKKPTATVIHHGTSFEILNPHESLHFSRIVSYIEDVDSYSTGRNRDSYISTITEDTVIIEEDPWSYNSATQTQALEEEGQRTHLDIGDTQGYHHPMPSINELLEETDLNMSQYLDSRPRPCTSLSNESDLGEPGSPVYEDSQPMILHDALWQYDVGRDPTSSHPYIPTVQEMTPNTEIRVHRRPTRRSNTSRKKRKGPFGKLCGLFHKKRFFPGR